ncbi:hypothetical protein Acr_13g0000400 [Actinidia rufa]|uniref:Uncharacterized protein n=1 Tax=Actinidia rufa TaxID=165716 RepID=A0A7J0FKG3_9ERIC|nr:hypothetical protein Acr_13g0000400 [Actinidia rufa]
MDTDMEAVGEISKKRKLPHNDDDDDDDDLPIEDHIDDEDEEKNMDMCFSIIRSYREARYHIMKGSSSSAKQEEEEEEEMIINTRKKLKMNKLELEEKPPLPPPVPVSVWKPSFRPEDFAQEDAKLPCMTCHDPPPPHVASPPKAPTQHHPRQGPKLPALDLNLSL